MCVFKEKILKRGNPVSRIKGFCIPEANFKAYPPFLSLSLSMRTMISMDLSHVTVELFGFYAACRVKTEGFSAPHKIASPFSKSLLTRNEHPHCLFVAVRSEFVSKNFGLFIRSPPN